MPHPTKKTAQDIQDGIFRKMPADKKIKLASDLTMFCLKLNRLNGFNKFTTSGNNQSGKTSSQSYSRSGRT